MEKSKRSTGVKKLNLSKKNIIISLIIFIIIVIIITAIVVIKERYIDTDSELVTEIYSYIGNNDLSVCEGLVNYGDDIVSFETIDNATRICNAYSMLELDETTMVKIDKTQKNNTCSIGENITFATDDYEGDICTVTKVASDLVNEQYKKMYGTDIETYEQFQYNDTTVCYYENNYFYCGLSESYTTTIGNEPETYRAIKSVYKDNDELVIYDYFIKIVNDECYSSFVGSTVLDTCSEQYDADEDITYNFLKKYGTLYKHTYKKNDNGYYWVQSEPVGN